MENNEKMTAQEQQHPAPADQPAQGTPFDVQMKAQQLVAQAQTIQQVSGVDVMALYNTDVEVRGRVLSGEWDFVDVWKQTARQPQPPTPVRSANGGVGSVRISAMDSRQFGKLNELLSRGGKVDLSV